jgi:hypothetical protein
MFDEVECFVGVEGRGDYGRVAPDVSAALEALEGKGAGRGGLPPAFNVRGFEDRYNAVVGLGRRERGLGYIDDGEIIVVRLDDFDGHCLVSAVV